MGTEHAVEAQKKAPKRNTESDDEDSNLLGYRKSQRNDAVTISKPESARSFFRAHKPAGGNYRPMNTLSVGTTLPAQVQTPQRNDLRDRRQMLAVGVSRGYNVRGNQIEEADETFNASHSLKRQKVVHPNFGTSVSSESIDELPAENVVYTRQIGKNITTYSHRQAPVTFFGTQPRVGMASEFGGLEDMMDSSQRKPKRRKASRLRKASSPLIEAFSRTDPVEIPSEDDQTPRTNGANDNQAIKTARSQPLELPHRNGLKSDDRKSLSSQTHSQYFPQRLDHPHLSAEHEQNLSTKFVASNGSRRGNPDYLSSDELDGPATIGEHADVIPLSPGVRRRAVSSKGSASIPKSARSSPEGHVVEPSNIKPTIFASHVPDKAKDDHQEDFEKDYLSGGTSWAVPLAAVSLPGQELHTSSDMKLVFDKGNAVYFVVDGGTPLRVSGSRLEVYPRSLQKCWWEKSGRRVRFESSKRGTADHILDLELESEKDLAGLTKKMHVESVNVKFTSEDSEVIKRRFENRRKQQLRPVIPPIAGFENMDEDVQMAAINQRRRENQDSVGQDIDNIGHRRIKLLNGLSHTSTNDSTSIDPTIKESPSTRQNDHLGRTNVGSATKLLGRPTLSDRFQPLHNDHLRRSARMSGALTKYRGTSPEPQEPKIKKYSHEFGLGEKWSRPLSFPKLGKKKATVEWEDLERLDEDEFLNDNLVSFYMRYLEQEFTDKNPELAETVYFFNSFFYDRLTTTQKGQKGINYEGVQRWTRGVDLFAYDYVVVPINELAHWYVAIICNLPALFRSEDPSKQASSPLKTLDAEQVVPEITSVIEGNVLEPRETQARQSFAEMSLDGKSHKRELSEDSLVGQATSGKQTENVVAIEEDREMLDVPNATNTGIDLSKPPDSEKLDPLEDENEGPRPGIPARKQQKRKSLPPSITKRDPASPVIITFDSFGHPHNLVIKVLKQYLYEEGNAKRNTEFNMSKIKGITAKNIPQQNNFSDCGLYMLGYVEKFLEDHPKDFIGKIIRREYDDRKDWPKMVPSNMRRSLREQLQTLHAEDEADRVAMKNAKHTSESRDNQTERPTLKRDTEHVGDAASNIQSKDKEDAATDPERCETEKALPINVPQICNARYDSSSAIEDEQGRVTTELEKNTKAAKTISGPTLEESLLVVENHDQTESPSRATQPEIPSSQPPGDPASKTDIRRVSPNLPTEIEDSQPLQLPTSGISHSQFTETAKQKPEENEDPGEYILSPGPSDLKSGERQDRIVTQEVTKEVTKDEPQNLVYSDWKPPTEAKGSTNNTPLSPPRSRKKGVAQRVRPFTQRQQEEQGKKMTKEDAIVLD